MKTYLLDANHASKLLDRRHPLGNRIRDAARAGDRFILLVSALEEVQYGVEAMPDPVLRARRQAALESLIGHFELMDLTLAAALASGHLRGRLRRLGWQLGPIDAHLAAVGQLEGCILLTDDGDFAPLRGELAIENWLR
jgi:predicted nucleic acid-binding protein